MDAIDLRLIGLLLQNARSSYAELARHCEDFIGARAGTSGVPGARVTATASAARHPATVAAERRAARPAAKRRKGSRA